MLLRVHHTWPSSTNSEVLKASLPASGQTPVTMSGQATAHDARARDPPPRLAQPAQGTRPSRRGSAEASAIGSAGHPLRGFAAAAGVAKATSRCAGGSARGVGWLRVLGVCVRWGRGEGGPTPRVDHESTPNRRPTIDPNHRPQPSAPSQPQIGPDLAESGRIRPEVGAVVSKFADYKPMLVPSELGRNLVERGQSRPHLGLSLVQFGLC